MLIRQAQFEAFHDAAVQQFEHEMVEHLASFAPELSQVAKKSGMQAAVHAGVEQASTYGFTNRGPVRLYLELMCAFGKDFDSDPQYPWARAALTDSQYPDQTRRARQLYRAAMQYFEEVAGPEDVHALAALAKVGHLDELAKPSSDAVTERILAGFRVCYPQKHDHVGEPALRILVANALALADAHEVGSDRHRALLAALLFGFGHGVLNDPLYPWIGGALRDPLIPNPEDRAERLHDRVRVYVDRMLRTLA